MTKSRRTISIISTAAAVLTILVTWELLSSRSRPVVTVGSAAPHIEAQTISGQVFRLVKFQGQPVFLDFFATWCPPCEQEAPTVNEFARETAGKLHVVLVDRSDSRALIHQFMKKYHLAGNITVLYNHPDRISDLFGVTGQPEGVFLSANGTVVAHTEGPMSLQQLNTLAAQAGMR